MTKPAMIHVLLYTKRTRSSNNKDSGSSLCTSTSVPYRNGFRLKEQYSFDDYHTIDLHACCAFYTIPIRQLLALFKIVSVVPAAGCQGSFYDAMVSHPAPEYAHDVAWLRSPYVQQCHSLDTAAPIHPRTDGHA